jgi:hypothetical protein
MFYAVVSTILSQSYKKGADIHSHESQQMQLAELLIVL